MRNIPNILTSFRVVLALAFAFFIVQEGFYSKIISFVIFSVACITDFLDGYIARKYDVVSDFGKIMDPVADKMLTLIAFFVFVQISLMDMWMFVAIFVREVGITIWRIIAMKKGIIHAADSFGKYKTVVQMVTIYFILILLVLRTTNYYNGSNMSWISVWMIVISVMIYMSVFLTVVSGIIYIIKNRKV